MSRGAHGPRFRVARLADLGSIGLRTRGVEPDYKAVHALDHSCPAAELATVTTVEPVIEVRNAVVGGSGKKHCTVRQELVRQFLKVIWLAAIAIIDDLKPRSFLSHAIFPYLRWQKTSSLYFP
jgi:hypothetical protein